MSLRRNTQIVYNKTYNLNITTFKYCAHVNSRFLLEKRIFYRHKMEIKNLFCNFLSFKNDCDISKTGEISNTVLVLTRL